MSIRFAMLLTLAAVVPPRPLLGSEPVIIAEGSSPEAPQQPQVAIDAGERIHLTYAVGDTVFYTRSRDGGKTFAPTMKLPPARDISLGMRRGPRIAVSDDVICVSVIGGRQGKGRDGDLLCYRSSDDGRTWQGPATVNDEPDAAREGLHAMASGADGTLCCVWLDLRSGGTEIMSSISQDGGATWGANIRVYRSPSGSVCECCHPSVHLSDEGQISVLFRNALDGKRDMYVATSSDGGRSFGEAVKLGKGTWPLKTCPMDGGAVVHTAKGQIATVWRRDRSVYLATSPAYDEVEIGRGEQPWIADTANGQALVWLTRRGGDLFYRPATDETTVVLAKAASDPVIATGVNRSLTAIAWESADGGRTQIVCQVVP